VTDRKDFPEWCLPLSDNEFNKLKTSYYNIIHYCQGYTKKIKPAILKAIYEYRLKNVPYWCLEAYFKEHETLGISYCNDKYLLKELYKQEDIIKKCRYIYLKTKRFYETHKKEFKDFDHFANHFKGVK